MRRDGLTGAAAMLLGEEHGQMAVEAAVVMPVMIAVAVAVLNLMWFLEDCSRFDRVSLDAVLSQAVSPAGEDQEAGAQEAAVAEAIMLAMGGARGVEVSVEARTVWDDVGDGLGFTFAPHLTRYVCTMSYRPWPSALTVAFIDAAIPFELEHSRQITVDRYRPGVFF